jgi:hypothetical protein
MSMINVRRLPFVAGGLAGLIVMSARCMSKEGAGGDPRGPAYAGMTACLGCHKRVGDTYLHTAHAMTSRVADLRTVAGPFTSPGNKFMYGPGREVWMELRDSGLFQVAVTPHGKELHRFDIAVGSGRKAQTYLYWEGDAVFQLPVSYFLTERCWANSPHYPMDSIWFRRTIDVGCFECHSSYISKKGMIHVDAFNGTPQYDRASIVYGIDCERCHGPGALHAAWQTAHKEDTAGRYIARFAALSRQQKLDVCAQCHSGGHASELRSVFHFKPGDTLANFYFADPRGAAPAGKMDVHGNQYELLAASKCFLRSATLECGSCHDPHVRERDSLTVFATRCMSCHGGGDLVNDHREIGEGMAVSFYVKNCIDCHMPARASEAITMMTQPGRDPVADLVRSHYIAIYPTETKKKLAGRRAD